MGPILAALAVVLYASLASALDLPMAEGMVLRNAEVKSVVDGSVFLTVKEDATGRQTTVIRMLSSFAEAPRAAIAGAAGAPEAAVAEAARSMEP
jgi:hypothetical protein